MDFFSNVFQTQRNGNSSRQQRRRTPPTPAGIHPNTMHSTMNSIYEASSSFATAAMAQAQTAASVVQEEMQEQGATPSASQKSIRQLPTIVVSSEDLVDENNRECCICFEEHNIGDKVIRLPCAHIYHSKCITEWLSRHCTCPVCRFELPTDDSAYEEKRKVRMASRKPRFARYELERMVMKDLIKLCVRLKLNNAIVGGSEKKEVIQAILDSGKIDIIIAPEPLEYESIIVLRGMGVGKLKKAMSDAGVFFDPKDVVEKEDMVQIFVNSGRIVLMQKEEEFDDNGYNSLNSRSYIVDQCKDDESNPKRARRDELVCNEDKCCNDSLPSESSNILGYPDNVPMLEKKPAHVADSSPPSESQSISEDPDNVSIPDEKPAHVAGEDSMQSLNDYDVVNVTTEEGREFLEESSAGDDTAGRSSHLSEQSRCALHNDYANSASSLQSEGFTRTSVASLRELAATLHIDLSDCIEKKEMKDRILAVVGKP